MIDHLRLDASIDGLRAAALSKTYISLGSRRTSSPHEFYRYPARFSPDLVRAVIDTFTEPGDLVLDPFVGGGTTVLEAMAAGRRSVGADINTLAIFVSGAKTELLTDEDIAEVEQWRLSLARRLNAHEDDPGGNEWWEERGYLKGLHSTDTWCIRRLLAQGIAATSRLWSEVAKRFCRLVLLRTGQWALDMRSTVPKTEEFKDAIDKNCVAMIEAATRFRDAVGPDHEIPTLIQQGLPGLATDPFFAVGNVPRLIVTSPPYPGVYVNYHRWKLRGRLETPAPYWVAHCNDGHGLAHYTMSARADRSLGKYFARLAEAYTDLRAIAGPKTVMVQVVGFNDVDEQLPRYLDTMVSAGFAEIVVDGLATDEDGRLWRDVPGRRWWTQAETLRGGAPSTAREVVLIHKTA